MSPSETQSTRHFIGVKELQFLQRGPFGGTNTPENGGPKRSGWYPTTHFQGGNGVFNKYLVRSFGEKGFGKMNDWLETSLVRYNVLRYMIIVTYSDVYYRIYT